MLLYIIYIIIFKACFTLNLQPKCSWCEFSPHLVTLTLFGHFRQKELLLIKFTHPFNPIRSWREGGEGSDAWMTTQICHSETSYSMYDAQML